MMSHLQQSNQSHDILCVYIMIIIFNIKSGHQRARAGGVCCTHIYHMPGLQFMSQVNI